MEPDAKLQVWAVIWLVTALALAFQHWRPGRGVGLILSYVVSFGAIHWLAPALDLLPWYDHRYPALVADGMEQSGLALLSFAIGVEGTLWVMRRRAPELIPDEDPALINPRAIRLYLLTGVLLHTVLFPLAHGLPSVTALVATGSTLFVISVGLSCWNAWQRGNRRTVWLWLAASMLLPFFTVATQGFLGYGMAAMMTVFAFVGALYGPRFRVLVLGAAVAYLGLSVYVTYMRDRADIREVVWSGSSLNDRTNRVLATLSSSEWFDLRNIDHLARIDERLNQNFLIGASVHHIESGGATFARGATVVDAALGIVPRALWPNKPVTAGSGDLVSIHTGIRFDRNTSVGIGQVMEAYVNFGTMGVVIGFLVIGAVMAVADRSAFLALYRADLEAFTLWYLPGLSLLQLGGSLVEVTSTAAAGLVVALVLNAVTRRLRDSGTADDEVPAPAAGQTDA
jgi:hypothetical protein